MGIRTNSYKYLGDTVTNDNKNKRNLEIRENGVQARFDFKTV